MVRGPRSEDGASRPSISDLSPSGARNDAPTLPSPPLFGVPPMKRCIAFATVAVALVLSTAGSVSAFGLFGGCGCSQPSCGCEASCGCEQSCACEQSCCAPSCGSCCSHRCCLLDGIRGLFRHHSCGCSSCCEPCCGAEQSCGCNSAPSCGCGN